MKACSDYLLHLEKEWWDVVGIVSVRVSAHGINLDQVLASNKWLLSKLRNHDLRNLRHKAVLSLCSVRLPRGID